MHRRLLFTAVLLTMCVGCASTSASTPSPDPTTTVDPTRTTRTTPTIVTDPETSGMPGGGASTFAAVTSPPPDLTDPAVRDTIGAMYGRCLQDEQARPVTDVDIADDRARQTRVAVIGDSITSQIRDDLLHDSDVTAVWSRCGATAGDVITHSIVDRVTVTNPDVLVVALGTNDANWEDPTPGASNGFDRRADQIVAAAAARGVRCVAWVNVAVTANHGPVFVTEAVAVNSVVNRLNLNRVGTTVEPVDWHQVVTENPAMLVDGVHLSPIGKPARTELMRAAVDACQPNVGVM